jgi:hypothetical protein
MCQPNPNLSYQCLEVVLSVRLEIDQSFDFFWDAWTCFLVSLRGSFSRCLSGILSLSTVMVQTFCIIS